MRKLSFGTVVLGILLISYSFTMSAYTNREEYKQKYFAIDRQELGSDIASARFHELRRQYLTPKYALQDHGATFLILGIVGVFLFKKGLPALIAPNSRIKIALLGLLAVILTVFGSVADLHLESFRGRYPAWADTLAIPLFTIIFITPILCGWVIINLLGASGTFVAGARIDLSHLKGSNYWFLTLMLITSLYILLCIVNGYPLMLLPSLLWLYFYTSIWVGRKAADKSVQATAATTRQEKFDNVLDETTEFIKTHTKPTPPPQ